MASEAQQLAAQKERQRKARVKRAESDRKRANDDLKKAQAKLKSVGPNSYSRIDFERQANDAKRRVAEADQILKDNGTAAPTTTASAPASKGSMTPGPGFGLREYERPLLAPIDHNNRDQVIWRQTELRNMGADIVIDGVWGPITQWFEGMANNGDLHPASPASGGGAPSSVGGVGGGGRAGGGSGGGARGGMSAPAVPSAPTRAPSSSLSLADFKTRVLAEIPQAAAFLSIPELVPILQSRLDGAISDQEFAAQVQQTNWYQTTPAKSRAWLGLYAIDPASAERQIQEKKAEFKSLLGDYALNLADVTIEQWARKTLSGEVPDAAYTEFLREQAKSLFPTLSGAIDRGVTVRQYADQYAQRAADRLGITPESINFGDEKWRRALVRVDPKTGERSAMNLDEWDTELRTNQIYGYDRSKEAVDQAASFVTHLEQTFGRAG